MTRLEKLSVTFFGVGVLTMVAALPVAVLSDAFGTPGWPESPEFVSNTLLGIGGFIAIVAGALMLLTMLLTMGRGDRP